MTESWARKLFDFSIVAYHFLVMMSLIMVPDSPAAAAVCGWLLSVKKVLCGHLFLSIKHVPLENVYNPYVAHSFAFTLSRGFKQRW